MEAGLKVPVMAALALSALAAPAFNRAAWLEQRRQIRREAAAMAREYPKFAARVVTPGENITIPIDTYPDGKVKTSLFAVRAYMFIQENIIWGEDVQVKEFDHSGIVTGTFRAKNILADRKRKTGWVPNNAEIEYSGTIVSGSGNYLDLRDKFVSIGSKAKIVSRNLPLRNALESLQRSSEVPTNRIVKIATITAERADYDNLSGVIFFDGDVHARNDDFDLHARCVYVFLEGTNQLKRVVAEGSVAMTNGSRSVVCDQAVFSRDESKLVLFGRRNAPARMLEDAGRKGEVEGSRIVYWTDSEQIEVSDSSITVEAGALRGDQLKKALGTEE